MDYQDILNEAAAYVKDFFAQHPDQRLVYHNMMHTQNVVQAATDMAGYYHLNDDDRFVVIVASWFHDIGYFQSPQSHEQSGADAAEKFLSSKNIPENIIVQVRNCIMATRLPQSPKTLVEQIVCDADLYHLGTDAFAQRNKLMRKEVELFHDKKVSGSHWRDGTIALLQQHHYHTDYAKQTLEATKKQNLLRLIQKQNDMDNNNEKNEELIKSEEEKKPKKKNKKDPNRPDRGIETMFRITSGNNQKLSDMADNKAHIMISVNSIILSAIITLLLRKLSTDSHLLIPTYIILSTSLLTIIFSIIATRPRLPRGTFTPADIQNKKVNLLFFGNFYKMSFDDYEKGMLQMMEDREYLYGNLIKDIYGQGIVLGRKYRLLRISYNVFMFGLIISVIAFIIATFYIV